MELLPLPFNLYKRRPGRLGWGGGGGVEKRQEIASGWVQKEKGGD